MNACYSNVKEASAQGKDFTGQKLGCYLFVHELTQKVDSVKEKKKINMCIIYFKKCIQCRAINLYLDNNVLLKLISNTLVIYKKGGEIKNAFWISMKRSDTLIPRLLFRD